MKKLTVLYDAECALCQQCRAFLLREPAYILLEFVPLQTPDLASRFPGIEALHPEREIIVIADTGEIWQGGHAWITCLYALKNYREWSYRLASPALLPLAKRIVTGISSNRHFLSQFFAKRPVCACDG
jgi:predicted DCC family thiol-disulfide oxidoreductase YuxK